MSNTAFKVMALIHDNPLRCIFENPIKTLKAAGIKPGQQVLEVGCGPGFFTIPVAKLVGDNGYVYAIDLHPLAIKTVEEKLQKTSLNNVKITIADAEKMGLITESIDLVFLFGVIHALPLDQVLPELYRVLRPGGVLAVQTFPGHSLERVTKGGLFTFVGKEGRVSKFQKEVSNESGL
jgi:demethylmenaquinone methyltransferase/2-methoxy-6-polyprenyl-1,4-benzoquinol methylase